MRDETDALGVVSGMTVVAGSTAALERTHLIVTVVITARHALLTLVHICTRTHTRVRQWRRRRHTRVTALTEQGLTSH